MFKLPEDLHDKYRFVTLAGLRAVQLQSGARPRVGTRARKATIIAQEEVALGLVEAWEPNRIPPEADAAVDVAAEEPDPETIVLAH